MQQILDFKDQIGWISKDSIINRVHRVELPELIYCNVLKMAVHFCSFLPSPIRELIYTYSIESCVNCNRLGMFNNEFCGECYMLYHEENTNITFIKDRLYNMICNDSSTIEAYVAKSHINCFNKKCKNTADTLYLFKENRAIREYKKYTIRTGVDDDSTLYKYKSYAYGCDIEEHKMEIEELYDEYFTDMHQLDIEYAYGWWKQQDYAEDGIYDYNKLTSIMKLIESYHSSTIKWLGDYYKSMKDIYVHYDKTDLLHAYLDRE